MQDAMMSHMILKFSIWYTYNSAVIATTKVYKNIMK